MSEVQSLAVIGPDYVDSLESNLSRAATRLGLRSVVVPYRAGQRGMASRVRRAASKRIAAVAEVDQRRLLSRLTDEFDLVLVLTGAAASLLPDTVKAMQQRSRHVFAWFVDSTTSLGKGQILRAPYERTFVVERQLETLLRGQLGRNALLLPEGHDPQYHQPREGIEGSGEIAVVGNFHPARVLLLERLLADGFPLRLYGNPLPKYASAELAATHSGRWIAGEEKSKVFQGAAAVLNTLHPSVVDSVNCRVFEAMASGAVVVSERRPMMLEMFDEGRDLLTYRDYGELTSALEIVLGDSGSADAIRSRAVRASRHHTLDVRLERIIDEAQSARGSAR